MESGGDFIEPKKPEILSTSGFLVLSSPGSPNVEPNFIRDLKRLYEMHLIVNRL
jgi:hypothetical protein